MAKLPALDSSIDLHAVKVLPTLGSHEHRDRMFEAHHGTQRGYAVNEDLALMPGLLFHTAAPMHSRENMRAVAEGVGAMDCEKAAYWLDMATHRRYPRRALASLRCRLPVPETREWRS